MNTEHVPRPPAVAEIKKSAWKRAPPINSSDAESVEEIRGLINFARTVDRGMAISISRRVCMEAKLDGKLPRKLHRLVHSTGPASSVAIRRGRRLPAGRKAPEAPDLSPEPQGRATAYGHIDRWEGPG